MKKRRFFLSLKILAITLLATVAFASEDGSPAPSWEQLLIHSKHLKKDVAKRTNDIWRHDEEDSIGNTIPQGESDLQIIEFRTQIEELYSLVKKAGKNVERLSSSELEPLMLTVLQRLLALEKSPVLDRVSESVEDQLRTLRKDLTALAKYKSIENPELTHLPCERTMNLSFKTPNQACAYLSAPGDFILRKALLTEGTTEDDFGPKTMRVIRGLEKLKGAPPPLMYRHSEVISQIESYNNIETVSYYPWYFMISKPADEKKPQFMLMNKDNPEYFTYRTKFSTFRVKGKRIEQELDRRESALGRLRHKWLFHRMGTCADFVNWAYNNTMTSPWNRIPLIRRVIAWFYPPEAIQTPDDLANTPDAEKLCEIDNTELRFPQKVNARAWVNRVQSDLKSKELAIREHAGRVWQFLRESGVVSESGERLVDTVVLQKTRQALDWSDFTAESPVCAQ